MAVELVYNPAGFILDGSVPIIKFRTSERTQYRRCRRLWNWTSENRQNLTPNEGPEYFWFGTGIHYAMEDFHGYNTYGHPAQAWNAYCIATARAGNVYATDKGYRLLGQSMMQYYREYWLRNRPILNTLWVGGVPQTEVRVLIVLPRAGPNGEILAYKATLDRVVVDDDGYIWIQEYKSFKRFSTAHLELDDQCTSYAWIASKLYDKPVQGVIYTQFKKDVPNLPRQLASGKISTDVKQGTTAILYRDALIAQYGRIDRVPSENIVFLNKLVVLEGEESDLFVRRDKVYRNEYQLAAQGEKILMEIGEMLRPDLPIYPNPTRDCSWQCAFQDACLALDSGSDWEGLLEATTTQREEESDQWRTMLPQLSEMQPLPPMQNLPQGEMPKLVSREENEPEEWLLAQDQQ